jgi:hypothetical protein
MTRTKAKNNATNAQAAPNGVTIPHGVNTTRPDSRARRQIRFLLDARKEGERAIGQALIDLKAKRQMTPTIRKALRLFFDLLTGSASLLREFFPDVVKTIEGQAVEDYKRMLDELRADYQADKSAWSQERENYMHLLTTGRGGGPAAPLAVNEADEPLILISDAPRASAQEIALNMAESMGDLFA